MPSSAHMLYARLDRDKML